MHSSLKWLHRAEDALLVTLLGAMIALASTQILMRNLFDSGFVWIDPVLRVLVLWLGLLGATVATRNNKHISIDMLSRYLEGRAHYRTHYLLQAAVEQVSAWTCLVIAAYGFGWVRLDFVDGLVAFAGIPAWMLEAIVPLSFAIIGLRYLAMSWHSARLSSRQPDTPGGAAP
jgi:TRAP-type C4-dicarboxylate transport system permease small subunit